MNHPRAPAPDGVADKTADHDVDIIAWAERQARRLRAGRLGDPDRWADARDDALDQATRETGLPGLPETCPWGREQILADGWLAGT